MTAPAGAGGDYEFRHALLQEAAYDDLLPGERQRLHRAFAEALQRGCRAAARSQPVTGASSRTTGRPATNRAFEASVRAGEAAARAFAFADARWHDERARVVDDGRGPRDAGRIDRVELLGRARRRPGWRAIAAWRRLRREAVATLGPMPTRSASEARSNGSGAPVGQHGDRSGTQGS